LLPNFQNPTGRTMTEERRAAVAQVAVESGLPIIEDNPYGDLWFDAPPAPALSARRPPAYYALPKKTGPYYENSEKTGGKSAPSFPEALK
jgi:DNA-binding transcriptional MocR family regulator